MQFDQRCEKCSEMGIGFNDDGEWLCEDCHFEDLCKEQEQLADRMCITCEGSGDCESCDGDGCEECRATGKCWDCEGDGWISDG